jgi:hypothetical protein
MLQFGGQKSSLRYFIFTQLFTFLRASPRVCQNLLGKSCVFANFYKVMQIKKRVHLQQFDIIHLSNPDLTYIRNPKRNKIMFMPFHLLKNLHQKSLSIHYFFFILPPRGKHRWQPRFARVYMRVGRFQVLVFAKLICLTVGGQFFLFCQN